MADQYEQMAELAKLEIFAHMLESIGDMNGVREIRKQINKLKMTIQAENERKFLCYKGRTAEETEANIFSAILPLIRNNKEFTQFVFEELDAASQGNDYSKRFARNCGIASHYFDGALGSSSEIDREDGPQQFLSNSMFTLFGEPNISVPHRINVVKMFIEFGIKNGILLPYIN